MTNFGKTRFTRDPQLDSEGFFDPTSRCMGCLPTEPCSRSSFCERYSSPLRFCEGPWVTPRSLHMLAEHLAQRNLRDGSVTLHAGEYTVVENPPGWREVDGVILPPITWAEER